jgi:fatty-acyl-CoA synthase
MILAGALGVRFGLIDWRVGVGQLILDWPSKLALIAVLGGIFAIFAAVAAGFRKYGLRAAFSLVLPLATLAALVWLKSYGDGYPPVHDVATDWTQPIALSPALVRERGPDAWPAEDDPIVPASAGAFMMRRVAEVNGETCPGAHPVPLAVPVDQAYARAKASVAAQGLDLFSDTPASGRLEATATNLWLGLKDDVVVRVTAAGTGSKVDVRSVSRGGVADFGDNCRRVTDLVRLISGQPRSS